MIVISSKVDESRIMTFEGNIVIRNLKSQNDVFLFSWMFKEIKINVFFEQNVVIATCLIRGCIVTTNEVKVCNFKTIYPTKHDVIYAYAFI